MAYSEFYCDYTNGSNVNGGDNAGSPSMTDTAGTGAVSTVNHQYTSVATNGAVAVGQFISIFSGAATVAAFTARITAVSGGAGAVWVITYSTTAKSGTEPTTGSTYKANVGGCWKGPNAASAFPFTILNPAMTNVAADAIRVNLKNNANYAITATWTYNLVASGSIRIQGYTSTVGDGGKAIIDGGTSGASYVLLTFQNTNFGGIIFSDLIFQNNGATGSAHGITASGNQYQFDRVVVNSVRGNGFYLSQAVACVECETYACNQSNTANYGGFNIISNSGNTILRCISHDNSGSNSSGFVIQVSNGDSVSLIDCIADSNGQYGINIQSTAAIVILISRCTTYNNTSHGIKVAGTGEIDVIDNCILVNNGGYGIACASGTNLCTIVKNCAFYNNTSGQVSAINSNNVTGSITLTGDPFNAASTGDFTLNSISGAGAACRGTGRGNFSQTQASYTGSLSYPDVGANQHQDSGGGSVGGYLIGN